MTKRKPKKSRHDTYGISKVMDDKPCVTPERELAAAVILQAMTNVHFKVRGWEDDAAFLSGAGSFPMWCEYLGLDPRKTAKAALRGAFNIKTFITKH